MLGARFDQRFFSKLRIWKKFEDILLDLTFVRPARAALIDIEILHVFHQQNLIELGNRERADADLEAVQRNFSVVRVMLHVPQMAELMLSARAGPARLRRLHRQARQDQPFDELAD